MKEAELLHEAIWSELMAHYLLALNVPGISPSQVCGELSKKSLDRCRMNIMVGQANTVGTEQIPGVCPTNISAFQPVKHNLMTFSAVGQIGFEQSAESLFLTGCCPQAKNKPPCSLQDHFITTKSLLLWNLLCMRKHLRTCTCCHHSLPPHPSSCRS